MRWSPVIEEMPHLADLYGALLENYGGLGSTPRSALEGIADDLKMGRLTGDEALHSLGCTRDEMMLAIAYLVEHFAQWAHDRPARGD